MEMENNEGYEERRRRRKKEVNTEKKDKIKKNQN